ncbi:23S rRNA (guanosine(2251)-2'-O)-methyltransferase RlmB [bacterium]|nr:23S rRNA (guanosine(2251)-2'-O)-methyltransferase RlmB [bacterium]
MTDKTDAAAPAKGRRRKPEGEAAAAPAEGSVKPSRSRKKAEDSAATAAPPVAADAAPKTRTRRKAETDTGAAPAQAVETPAAARQSAARQSEGRQADTRQAAPERPAAARGDRSGFAEQQGGPRQGSGQGRGDGGRDDYDSDPAGRKRRRRGGRGRKRGEGEAPREQLPREQQPREQQPREPQRQPQGGRYDNRSGRPGPGGLRDPRDSRGGRPDMRGRDGQRGGRDMGRDMSRDMGRDGGGREGGPRGRSGGAPLDRSVPKGQLPADLIYGINAVSVALETGQLKTLYYDNGFNNERVKQIHAHAQDAGIAVLPLQRQGWSRALAGEQHQGVAGMLYPQRSHFLEEIVANAGEDSCVLVLDRVQDPHNLGAILRTAGAAGVDAVVLPKAGGCPVTPAVHRAAAGVSLLNRIVEDENIARALDFLKDQGYWVIGCDSEEGEDATTFEYPHKRVIVMGNEAEGMRRLVKEHCDYLVRIPMPGPKWLAREHDGSSAAMVESLNVSVATAIILYLSMSDLARAAHEAEEDERETEPTEEG